MKEMWGGVLSECYRLQDTEKLKEQETVAKVRNKKGRQ